MDQLRKEFEAIRPQLDQIREDIVSWLYDACRELAIYAPRIEGRTKQTHSLLLKVLRKERLGKSYESPLAEISDKVGVRADLVYAQDVDRLLEFVQRSRDKFEPITPENIQDKRLSLKENEVGYLGVHIDVIPLERHGLQREFAKCEIQIRTNAQAAWAMASHDLVYKPPIERSLEDKRKVNRLTTLFELFDEQIADARNAMMGGEGYPVAIVIEALQAGRFRAVGTEYDVALTNDLVSLLSPATNADDAHAFAEQIKNFVEQNENAIRNVLTKTDPPLASQPEAILIFMLLERDKFDLSKRWTKAKLPYSLLRDLAVLWAVDIPEPL